MNRRDTVLALAVLGSAPLFSQAQSECGCSMLYCQKRPSRYQFRALPGSSRVARSNPCTVPRSAAREASAARILKKESDAAASRATQTSEPREIFSDKRKIISRYSA